MVEERLALPYDDIEDGVEVFLRAVYDNSHYLETDELDFILLVLADVKNVTTDPELEPYRLLNEMIDFVSEIDFPSDTSVQLLDIIGRLSQTMRETRREF